MEAAGRFTARTLSRAAERLDPAGVASFVVPFALIVFLALSNGGYDVVERSQAGIAVWWIVLVGTAIGALAPGASRAGSILLALLAAFAGWTLLSLGWTESDERTAVELARVCAYLGFFAAALALQGTARWRELLGGITAAVAVVCGIAVLSRLEPGMFPERVTGTYLPGIEIEERLAYPLNYSSGLGAFAAIGLPLTLAAAWSARSLVVGALAAGCLPLVALTLWLTTSSLSLPAAAIGLAALFALSPDRLPKLGTLALGAAGSAVLFAAVEQRPALDRGLPTPDALAQGGEMEAIILVVCCGVALAHTGVALAVRYGERPAWLRIPRRTATTAALATGVLALVVAVAAGVPGKLGDEWDDFRSLEGGAAVTESRGAQILDFQSSGRYQFWESAVEASETDTLKGIGPGTFEFWWSREGSYSGFVRDAHSLYLETLAELGVVGLLLIVAFVTGVLLTGAGRALTTASPETRLGLAAATAGCLAFAAAAAVDWTWELGVIPAVFMGLAAVAVAGGDAPRPSGSFARIALCALAIAAIAAVAVPLTSSRSLAESRGEVAAGQTGAALAAARDASEVQPYAAGPHLQQALVLERAGQLDEALGQAGLATRQEPTNWRPWLILSRLEARAGNAEASVRAFRRARELSRAGLLGP